MNLQYSKDQNGQVILISDIEQEEEEEDEEATYKN